jgi:hypothetical protein
LTFVKPATDTKKARAAYGLARASWGIDTGHPQRGAPAKSVSAGLVGRRQGDAKKDAPTVISAPVQRRVTRCDATG